MARALSPSEVLGRKTEELPFDGEWAAAFDRPEKVGTWIIWGRSGNGKTNFVMQLAKELAKYGKVGFMSLEEGLGLSMQKAIERHGILEQNGRVRFYKPSTMAEFSEQLLKPRQPKMIIIDSFQYTQMNYKDYIAFKERHKDKLIIFISHANGTTPAGRSAVSVMFDASLKIYVNGYRAHSKGRFIGPKGYYTIWEEGAAQVWGGEISD